MMIKRLRMLDMERIKITDYALPAWPDLVWPFFCAFTHADFAPQAATAYTRRP